MLKNYEEKLEEIKNSITNIGEGLVEANKLVLAALEGCDIQKFSEAKTHIKNISKKTNSIDNSIITALALYSPEARDLRNMVSYLKITNELLRASINTRGFIKGFTDVCCELNIYTINEYAIPMQKSTVDSLRFTIDMINIDCADEMQEYFNRVLIAENKTDDLYEMIENSLLKEAKNINDFSKYHKMLSSLRKSEKIADRAMSIASLLLYAKNGGEIQ